MQGGSYVPTVQEIAYNFSLDHARILKLLDFFKNYVGFRVMCKCCSFAVEREYDLYIGETKSAH